MYPYRQPVPGSDWGQAVRVDVALLCSPVVAVDRVVTAETAGLVVVDRVVTAGQVGIRAAVGPQLVVEPVHQVHLADRVALHIASHSIPVVPVVAGAAEVAGAG